MINKNIEIGFQSAVFHICQQALVPFLRNKRPERNVLYLGLRKTQQSTTSVYPILCSIFTSTVGYEGGKIIRLLACCN